MRLIRRIDRNRRVTAVPYQKRGVPESVGLTVEDCRKAAWAVSSGDERRHRGAAAINMALSAALGTSLPYRFYGLPGIRRLQDLTYDWVANNRRRLPADTPYCIQHPGECR